MSITHITSTAHSLIKQRRKLHDKKGRQSQGLCVAEGLRTCKTLLASPLVLEELFVVSALQEEAERLAPEGTIVVVNDMVMKKLSNAATPSGILATFRIPLAPDPAELGSGIVLTHMSDPGNMGTLIRTCAALARPSLVCIEGVDPWSPKVIQASAGTIGYVTLFEWKWSELVQHCREKSVALSALVVTGGAMLQAVSVQDPHLFVIGSEAHGIPAAYLEDCAQQITLPMPGATESLNAAIAGSIALYLQYLVTQQQISL